MENASLSDEYGHYDEEVPDFPVDCADGTCVAIGPLRVAPLLLYAVIFLVGVPGNAMVAWVSRKEAQRRAGATWFLHLAAADLLCCLALPILSVPIARGGEWPYGAVGCRALPSVILLSMFTSVLLLAALSADLCLLALRPACWAPDRRACRVQVACGAAWTLALLLTLPSAIYHRLHREHYPARLECVVDYGGSAVAENTVAATRFMFGFLGPLVVVASCHGAILCRAAPRRWPLGTAVVVGFFCLLDPLPRSGAGARRGCPALQAAGPGPAGGAPGRGPRPGSQLPQSRALLVFRAGPTPPVTARHVSLGPAGAPEQG